MYQEEAYCRVCKKRTVWTADQSIKLAWCGDCKQDTTVLKTYDELFTEVDEMIEQWAELEKSEFLQSQKNKDVIAPFMNDLDHKRRHLSLITGDRDTVFELWDLQ